MGTEGKAKVVAFEWGEKFVQYFGCFVSVELKEMVEFNYFFRTDRLDSTVSVSSK